MFSKKQLAILLLPLLVTVGYANLDGLHEATGVNQTVEEGFGARQSGMAITFAGFQKDADAIANAPAAMNDVDDFTFSTGHAEKFGEAKFDDFALLMPFESNSTLGLGISRYGISGVDLRPEGSAFLQSQPPEVFSVADYLVVAAFARRWAGLDVGFNFNLLYRQLDQDGIGMRGDAMAQYTWDDFLRVGAVVKGLIPSSAAWESGYMEYEPTDIYIGAGARFPTPYFYGSLQVAFQSEGLLQKQAKSLNSLKGSRIYESPGQLFSTANLGMEYLFDFGVACRFGLNELAFSKSFSGLATFGIGYSWHNTVGIDYSFTPHPDLLSTHRISLQFTPAFPKFNGKNFRGRMNAGGPGLPSKSESPKQEASQAKPESAEPQRDILPGSLPESVPAPALTPVPVPGAKEILETDDEGQ